jgi:hypothetical protein
VPGHNHIAFVWRHFFGNDLKQGGFSCAIATNQTHAFAGFEYKIDTVEQDTIAVLDVDI